MVPIQIVLSSFSYSALTSVLAMPGIKYSLLLQPLCTFHPDYSTPGIKPDAFIFCADKAMYFSAVFLSIEYRNSMLEPAVSISLLSPAAPHFLPCHGAGN